ncbi:MAG: response regulator [Acidobacteria bacterium]|nr:response regulator [Acidobacteriota bacterium]
MSKEVLAAVSDMIFASKISGAASQTNINITFIKSADKLVEQANNLNPKLIILDLNNPRFDSLTAIKELKSNSVLCTIPIVGFLSHVQVELRLKAQEAGCDFTMPRSEFNSHLIEILSGEYFLKKAKR